MMAGNSRERLETTCYAAGLGLVNVMYLVGMLAGGEEWFGFSQWRHAAWGGAIIYGLILTVVVCRAERVGRFLSNSAGRLTRSPWRRLLPVAGWLAAFATFYLLANNFMNPDSLGLIHKIPRDAPVKGAHVTHDEMLELWVHSKFYLAANATLGWSVVDSYRFVSSVAGAFFLFAALGAARMLAQGRGAALLALLAAGGYMQLFFGDVENYTIMAALVMWFLYLGLRTLEGRAHVALPSTVLTVAMMFHLLAGWLLPMLLYLLMVEMQRGNRRGVASGILPLLLIPAPTLTFFHHNGLPIWDLFFQSHAFGHGKGTSSMLADLDPAYYFQMFNLVLLLFPGAWMAGLVVAFARRRIDRHVEFLLAGAAPLLVLIVLWKAQLGVYNDWNLFAPATLIIALVTYTVALRGPLGKNPGLYAAALLTFGFHSYCWIVSNHFVGQI